MGGAGSPALGVGKPPGVAVQAPVHEDAGEEVQPSPGALLCIREEGPEANADATWLNAGAWLTVCDANAAAEADACRLIASAASAGSCTKFWPLGL